MKKLACLLILLACLPAQAAKKIDTAKEDLTEVKAKIEALKQELDQNQAAHKDATDALKTSETAISQANKKLHLIARQQQQNQRKLNNLQQQSLSLNDKLASQQAQLGKMLYRQYTRGNQSYAQLILQNKNPAQITRDLAYFRYIAKARADLINGMQANLTEVKALDVATKTALAEVQTLKTEQEAQRKQLEAQKNEKSKVVKTLFTKIASNREQIDKLKRDEQSLSQLVERLAKIVPPKPKKKAASKLKESNDDDAGEQNTNNQTVVASNEQLPSQSVEGDFAKLRGRLRLPVRGDVANRFGSARADTGLTWKGLFIRATGGSEVKAVADGRVVFADWMRGFGNLIIVDHGDGYMTLYGNNQAVLKSVGEAINSGETIASVGNSGGNESDGLYYELRKNSKPLDPMAWSNLR